MLTMAHATQPLEPEEEDIKCDNDHLRNYEVRKQVGSGEFCDVFRAIKRDTGQVVALKRLKMRQMFSAQNRMTCLREIRVLRKLNHPNIIRHIESFFANNELFIALEYADCGDLSRMLDYLRKHGNQLSEKKIWNFFGQVCAGLAYMHSQWVMHRDIKPANVLINRDHTVKLADFGLSLLLSATTDNARSLVGTPYYMAPERLNEQEYSFSADIWSLGCLLYELVTLHPPFYDPNQSLQMLIQKIRNFDLRPLGDGYSAEIGFIITNCLVWEPDRRIELKEIHSIAQQMQQRFARPPQLDVWNEGMDAEPSANSQFDQQTSVPAPQPHPASQPPPPLLTSMTDIATHQSSTMQPNSLRKIYRTIKRMF